MTPKAETFVSRHEIILWYPTSMSMLSEVKIASLDSGFKQPITLSYCNDRCAPCNQKQAPLTCDTLNTVLTAYPAEWEYWPANTSLRYRWRSKHSSHTNKLAHQKPLDSENLPKSDVYQITVKITFLKELSTRDEPI